MLVHTKMMWFEDLFMHNLSSYMPFLSCFRVFFGIFTFFSANDAFIIYEYRPCSVNRSDFLGSHREDEISSPCPSSLTHPPNFHLPPAANRTSCPSSSRSHALGEPISPLGGSLPSFASANLQIAITKK